MNCIHDHVLRLIFIFVETDAKKPADIEKRRVDIALLCKQFALVANFLFPAFSFRRALQKDNLVLANKLLSHAGEYFITDETFGLACQHGLWRPVLEILLQDPRVDPSANGNNAIRRASANGHDKVVALLLEDPRINPAAEDNYAFRWASKKGHDKVVAVLERHTQDSRKK